MNKIKYEILESIDFNKYIYLLNKFDMNEQKIRRL